MLRKRLTLLSWSSASRTATPTKAGTEVEVTESPEKLRELRQFYLERYFTAISSRASKTKEQLEQEQVRREKKARKTAHYKSVYDSIAKSTENGDSKKVDVRRQLSQSRSAGLQSSRTKIRVRHRTHRLLNNPGLAFREYAEFVDIPTDRAHIHVDDQAVFFENEDESDYGKNESADNATNETKPALPDSEQCSSSLAAASPPQSTSPPPSQPLHATCHFCRTAHVMASATAGGGAGAEGDGGSSTDAMLLSGHDETRLRSVYERGRRRARARRQNLAELFSEPTHGLCATIHGRLSSLSLSLPSVESSS